MPEDRDNCNKGCPFVYAPVCGSNNETYDNDCLFEVANCKSGYKLTITKHVRCSGNIYIYLILL